MKFNDSVFGVFFIVFALAIISYAQLTFPPLHGQKFDSRDFPTLIGIGLLVCGCLLLINGIRLRLRGTLVGANYVSFGDWIKTHRLVVNFASVIVGILLFMVLLDVVGFLIGGCALLFLLFHCFGNSLLFSALGAIGTTVLIYGLFALLLRVPLPLGPLGY